MGTTLPGPEKCRKGPDQEADVSSLAARTEALRDAAGVVAAPSAVVRTPAPRTGAGQGSRCMVLNASYEYLSITRDWFDSLLLVLDDKAVAIEHYPEVVRSQYHTFQVPAVVVMRYQVQVKKRSKLFQLPTKKAVFIRDNFECQYCGTRLTMGSGTRDHVVPRAQGGIDTLANVVASCKPCNGRKADRTPEQAGMPLAVRPRPLTDEEKIRCVLKTCRAKERQTWLCCLKRLGITLWAS